MKLLTLKIKNFKSVIEKEITFGRKTHITGRNASGKTTIQDAYTWLLFDRDSNDNTTAEIRPLDAQNRHKNYDPIQVIATIETDGKKHKIEKIMTTRVKDDKLTNTNKYIVDDLEMTKTKYKEFIASITDELTFKLLSNPYYFSTLKTDEKRKLLLQLIDDPTEELKTELPELTDLIEENKETDISEKIKQYTTSINRQKKEIDSTKSKLEEYINNEFNPTDYENAKYQLEQLHKEENNQKTEKLKQITEITKQIAKLEQKEDKTEPIVEQKLKIEKLEQEKTQKELQKTQLNEMATILRRNWESTNEKLNNISTDAICPTCFRPITPELAEEEKKKLEKELQEITNKGIKYKNQLQSLTDEVEDYKNEINIQIDKLTELENRLKNDTQGENQAEITMLRLRLSEIENSQNIALQEQIQEATQKLYIEEDKKIKSTRKEELKMQLKEQQHQINELEQRQFKLATIENAKNQKLEDKLNALSKNTKFKLFEKTNTGEVKPTCKIMVNTNNSLVEYQDANTGGKINAGLEIIKMLTTKNEPLPIWIDNTESIELKLDTDTQIIMLEVKKGEELKIETEE